MPAQQADEAEKHVPEPDSPAEIARRKARLAAIAEAGQRLAQRQRDADIEPGSDAGEPPTRLQAARRNKRADGHAYLVNTRSHHRCADSRLRR
jgi:hypothetical protein